MMKYENLKEFRSENGAISIAYAMAIVFVLFVFASALLTTVGVDIKGSTNNLLSSEAYYVSEAGVEWALKMLSDSSDWRDGATNVSVGNGSFTVTIDDSSSLPSLQDTILITSTGYYSDIQKNVQVRLLIEGSFPYVMMAGNDIDFSSGKGTIEGNLHANTAVKLNSQFSVNGTVTQSSPTIGLPIIDWSFYADEALADGQYVTGDKSFNSSGSPYSGVWYVKGTATIPSNHIEINGTIVVENDFEITKNNAIITATPSNYPALIVGNTATIEMNNAEINGFVYCGNDFEIKMNNFTSNGAIIAGNTLKNNKNNTSITFDDQYMNNIMGVTFPAEVGGNGSLDLISWQEN